MYNYVLYKFKESTKEERKEMKQVIPKQSAKLLEIVNFYLNSEAFKRLKPRTQKDYELHLNYVVTTVVEGKELGGLLQ